MPPTSPAAVLALPFDLGRHELAIRGALPQERIDVIVYALVVPLLALHSHAEGAHGTDQPERAGVA